MWVTHWCLLLKKLNLQDKTRCGTHAGQVCTGIMRAGAPDNQHLPLSAAGLLHVLGVDKSMKRVHVV